MGGSDSEWILGSRGARELLFAQIWGLWLSARPGGLRDRPMAGIRTPGGFQSLRARWPNCSAEKQWPTSREEPLGPLNLT